MDNAQSNPKMPDANKCPECGTPLETSALGGLCPACLLKQGVAADTVTGGKQNGFTPPTVEELAEKFPQLEILELIGKGGMGAVYKARQKELDRIVALKILPPGIGDDPAFAGRFSREARALAKLNHPNIVTLYEFGRADGLFFFLMEYVDGVNLRQLLSGERISAREALAIVPQICDALQFAHDHGIVHRDIKPENILMDRRGRVKVADFGLAKIVGAERSAEHRSASGAGEATQAEQCSALLTDAGKVMGTPQYMSPEQIHAPGQVDHRADIYALGVVFYQMLTGELPGKRIEPPSKKVQIDVRLDEIVLRALEKNPERRYEQASVLKTQVETIATSPEADGASPATPHQPKPLKEGDDFASWVVVLCISVLIAAIWGYFSDLRQGQTGWFLGRLVVVPVMALGLYWLFLRLPGREHHQSNAMHPAQPSSTTEKPAHSRLRSLSRTILNIGLATLFILTGWAAYELGIFFNAVFVFLLLMVVFQIGILLWRVSHGSLETGLWRRPFVPELHAHRWQVLNRWIFWLLAAWVLKLCIVPPQFSPEQYSIIRFLIWGGTLALLLLALLPGKRIHIIPNLAFAIGSLFMAIQIASIYSASNKGAVILSAPFRGEWLVVQGGSSPLVNHHHSLSSQRYALDLEKLDNGLERTGNPKHLESYPSWGEPLFAPAIGKVVKAVGHLPDNPIGQTDDHNVAGNHLIIDMGKERFVLMAHLKQGSLRVKEGDVVKAGQPIAQCGNSGNTSHPHLHLQVQTKPEFYAAGIGTYPIVFSDGHHVRAGRTLAPTTALPLRNDRIIGGDTEKISKTPETPTAFGPVIERVVEEPVAPDFKWFDLDTGTSVSSSHLPDDVEDAVFENWMRKAGVDIAADADGRMLMARGGGFVALPVQANLWQSGDAKAVVDLLSQARSDAKVAAMSADGGLPSIYVFRTREGGRGILQITGSTDNPRGVKIRYKLVEKKEPVASTKPAENPKLTKEQRAALVAEAQRAFSAFVGRPAENRKSDDIPEPLWGESIRVLKPLRVVNDRANIKFVLHENEGIESGLYVNLPISSYAPQAKDFLEFIPLNQPNEEILGQIYRYERSTISEANDSGGASVFGPVFERTLQSPSTARTNAFLDFDTGKVVIPPESLDVTEPWKANVYSNVWNWALTNGVDAVADTSEQVRGLRWFGLSVASVPDSEWDNGTAQSIEVAVNNHEAKTAFHNIKFPAPGDDKLQSVISANTLSTHGEQWKTYAVRTGAGTLGILQLLQVSDEPRGFVTFRYKLISDGGVSAKNAFEPAIERVLSGQAVLLNLERGWVSSLPTETWREQFDDEGAVQKNSLAALFEKHWLLLSYMEMAPMTLETWENVTEEQIAQALESDPLPRWQIGHLPHLGILNPDPTAPRYFEFSDGATPPVLFGFQTGEGRKGILQVVDFSVKSQKPQMKVRYRLVQENGSEKAASAAVITNDAGESAFQFRWVATAADNKLPFDTLPDRTSANPDGTVPLLQQVLLDETDVESTGFTKYNGRQRELIVFFKSNSRYTLYGATSLNKKGQLALVWHGEVVGTVEISKGIFNGLKIPLSNRLTFDEANRIQRELAGNTTPSTPAKSTESLAVADAQTWLGIIDEGRYAPSWESAAAVFQTAVSKAVWVSQLEGVRAPLGKLVSRKLVSAQHTTNLPGTVGEHVVMQFKTAFGEMPIAVETVTFTLEKDGTWKASGYYIK